MGHLLEDYIRDQSQFVKEISFNDHGKIRNIVTYDTQKGKFGRELKKEHEQILGILDVLPSSEHSYAYKKGVRIPRCERYPDHRIPRRTDPRRGSHKIGSRIPGFRCGRI